METVFDYRIPVLHPFAVHFPVTLLVTAAIAALVWMYRGTAFWRRCCFFLLLLSTPAAAFAYFTGEEMEERSEGVPIVDDLVELHERMALITLLLTAAVALLFSIYTFRAERTHHVEPAGLDPIGGRVAMSLLVLLVAALVSWTAHIGATMTWGVAL